MVILVIISHCEDLFRAEIRFFSENWKTMDFSRKDLSHSLKKKGANCTKSKFFPLHLERMLLQSSFKSALLCLCSSYAYLHDYSHISEMPTHGSDMLHFSNFTLKKISQCPHKNSSHISKKSTYSVCRMGHIHMLMKWIRGLHNNNKEKSPSFHHNCYNLPHTRLNIMTNFL